uniref:ATP-binding cassette domain-containing protein n=1 Tax=Ignisphaera aggregans TaxID=334771 RepID=A0A7C4FB68_9CREN
MEELNIGDDARKPIGVLSREALQKTAIATALAVKPRVVVMDEPLTSIEIDMQISFKTS